jgi:hypothetical protein
MMMGQCMMAIWIDGFGTGGMEFLELIHVLYKIDNDMTA